MSTAANADSEPKRRTFVAALRRSAFVVGLVTGGFVLGAVSFASASGMMHGGHWRHGPRIGMIQRVLHGALDNVGATSAQEDKIHDIIATTYQKLDTGEDQHKAFRKQVLDLLKAPQIDRAAVEKMRADRIAEMDAKSKLIVGAALDAAAELTPVQRTKLADLAQERMAHHDGWHHHGPDGEHGAPPPDGGPDHAPDDGGHP